MAKKERQSRRPGGLPAAEKGHLPGDHRLPVPFPREEAYLRDHYLDQMKAKLIPKGMESFNYHLLPGKTLTAQKLAETVDALPMMSERTLVVVNDYDIFKGPRGGAGRPDPDFFRPARLLLPGLCLRHGAL